MIIEYPGSERVASDIYLVLCMLDLRHISNYKRLHRRVVITRLHKEQ